MTSRANLLKTLNHEQPDRMCVDFGATPVTGIHALMVEQLREHFGLEKRPVKVHEPYQMLAEVEDDLQEAMGVDVIGVSGEYVYHGATLIEAEHLIEKHVGEHGPLTIANLRDLTGSSRKYVVPLAEHLDGTGFTRRQGDERITIRPARK